MLRNLLLSYVKVVGWVQTVFGKQKLVQAFLDELKCHERSSLTVQYLFQRELFKRHLGVRVGVRKHEVTKAWTDDLTPSQQTDVHFRRKKCLCTCQTKGTRTAVTVSLRRRSNSLQTETPLTKRGPPALPLTEVCV